MGLGARSVILGPHLVLFFPLGNHGRADCGWVGFTKNFAVSPPSRLLRPNLLALRETRQYRRYDQSGLVRSQLFLFL